MIKEEKIKILQGLKKIGIKTADQLKGVTGRKVNK